MGADMASSGTWTCARARARRRAVSFLIARKGAFEHVYKLQHCIQAVDMPADLLGIEVEP